ncbi:MAG: SPOR domain-containing protein [Candidatus Magnetominusculus sp. LBB02]|nr:SPOR domain-containing protein [Candidatus Magnetominusculus sp. LBB02]
MKGRVLGKIGYNFIEGKGLLIVIVVLFSSASFIMGFFAGKKVSLSAAPQALKIEPAFTQANMVKPTPAAQPPLASPARAAEEPLVVSKPAETTIPVEEPKRVETVSPQPTPASQPKLTQSIEQPKPEPPKQPTPSPESAVTPNPAHTRTPAPEKHAREAMAAAPSATPAAAKPTPHVVKDVLTPVSPPPQQGGALYASKTIAKQPATAPTSAEKYYIQLGAFKGVGDAMRLQEDLRLKGFESEIVKNSVNEGVTLFKVRIGGQLTKAEVSQTMAKLNKRGFKGFIRELPR